MLSAHDSPSSVDPDTIKRQPSWLASIRLCVQLSGLQDNQVAMELGIQEAQFSRILAGKANFPPNKLTQLMDVCSNEIPLQWLAYHRGYGLVRLKSALERDLEASQQENAELRLKLSHFEEFQRIGSR